MVLPLQNWQAMNTTEELDDWIPDEFENEGRFVPEYLRLSPEYLRLGDTSPIPILHHYFIEVVIHSWSSWVIQN